MKTSSPPARSVVASERRLYRHLENSPLAIIEWDHEFRVCHWNRRAEEIFGWAPTDVLGKHAADWPFIYPEDAPSVGRIMQELVEGRLPGNVSKNRNYTKAGGVVHCEWYNSSLVDNQGNLVSVLSQILDVSERVEFERSRLELAAREAENAALGRHQRWLEMLLDLTPTAIILLEPGTGRVTFSNEAANAMAGGYFPRDVPIERYAEAYAVFDAAGNQLPSDRFPAARAARGDRVDGEEIVWKTPAGALSCRVYSQMVPAMFGHAPVALMVIQDVSALKLAERDLQRAVRARDEFLSIASHELKTPVTPLQLRLELMLRQVERATPEAQRGQLERSIRDLRRLSALIARLLDVSLIGGGGLQITREPLELGHVVEEMLERNQESLQRAGCLVERRIASDVWVAGDRLRLEQVLENLLNNAMKYGAGRPIEVSLDAPGGDVVLSVADHGVGIPPEDQERIFGRFERGTDVGPFAGMGLGLFIAQEIIREHGGRIEVASRLGQGTRFTFRIPRLARTAAAS